MFMLTEASRQKYKELGHDCCTWRLFSPHFLVLPSGLMKIPHDAYEAGEMTHISLSLSLAPFSYFLIYGN